MTPCPRAAQLWAAEGWLRTTERFHWMQNHTTSSAGQLLRKASLPLASEGCVRSSRWVLVLVLFRCSAGLQLAQCARCLGESNTGDATSLSFDFFRFVGVSNLRVAVSQRTLRETPLQLPAEKGGCGGTGLPLPCSSPSNREGSHRTIKACVQFCALSKRAPLNAPTAHGCKAACLRKLYLPPRQGYLQGSPCQL